MADLALLGAALLIWIEAHPVLSALVFVALLVPGSVSCYAARCGVIASRASMQRIEGRLTHICSAVELLTDTTEGAFRSTFTEIERLTNENLARADHRLSLQQRVNKAATYGRTPWEIAQLEGVSEGEVRLRMRLQGQRPEEGTAAVQ